jgi:ribosomal protein S12 methylthiotransferase
VGFVSLGCPKNLVDTEVMMGLLRAGGHELTSDPGRADVIVVNTCSFIGPAQQESVDAILEMARYKREGSARRLIVAGCLVERFRQEIQAQVPEVDAVVGANQVEQIVAACEGRPLAEAPRPFLYHDAMPRVLASPRHYAYIKIAEGCDHPCTFCIIPQLRGAFRSRQPDSVIAEAASLFSQGVREINLVGQDTTSYGADLGLQDGLAMLLQRLDAIQTPGPKWIRFLYAYPNRISSRLLDVLAAHPSLVKYIDMPLQHASAAVLKRMRRGSSADRFLKLIETIRRRVPGVVLRTSMIVGFPGETERDFELLCQFLQEARFDHLGVFSYSDEETSRSYHLDGKVPPRLIYNRKRRLLSIQRRISRAKNRQRIGTTAEVLLEGPSPESDLLWQARLPGQAPEIDGVCLVNDFSGAPPRPGQIRPARITAAHDYDLVVTVLDSPAHSQSLPILNST